MPFPLCYIMLTNALSSLLAMAIVKTMFSSLGTCGVHSCCPWWYDDELMTMTMMVIVMMTTTAMMMVVVVVVAAARRGDLQFTFDSEPWWGGILLSFTFISSEMRERKGMWKNLQWMMAGKGDLYCKFWTSIVFPIYAGFYKENRDFRS